MFTDAGVVLQYASGLQAKVQDEREAKLVKIRPSTLDLLKGNLGVHHCTTFPTVDKLFVQRSI